MKTIFFLIIIITQSCQLLFSQNYPDISQTLEKAIIKNKCLYFHEGNRIKRFIGIERNTKGGNNAYLRIVPLDSLSHPIYNDLMVHSSYGKEYDFSFCWDILPPYTYVIGTNGGYHEPGDRYVYQKAPSISLLRIPINKKDTNCLINEYYNYLKHIHAQYPEAKDCFKAQIKDQEELTTDRNPQGLLTIENLIQFWVENMPSESWMLPSNPFSFDFFMKNNYQAEFFIRDFKGFSHWIFQYPKVNQPNTVSNWTEKITYYSDSVKQISKKDSLRIFRWGQEKITFNKQYLPKNTLFNTINDPEFLRGNFKVYNQENDRFIINVNYGGIYWLAPTKVIKVGQINMTGYKRKLFGKLLFIEDRDKGELIFFSKIEKLNSETPFPKIRSIIEENEFNKKFKFLLIQENGIFETTYQKN